MLLGSASYLGHAFIHGKHVPLLVSGGGDHLLLHIKETSQTTSSARWWSYACYHVRKISFFLVPGIVDGWRGRVISHILD